MRWCFGHIDVVKAADGMFAPKIERRQNVRARNIGYEVFAGGGDEFNALCAGASRGGG